MRSKRTQLLVLVVLVGMWAALVFLRQPGGSPPPAAPAPAGARAPRPASGGLPKLRADLLAVARAPYPAGVQNIFGSPPPPPPPQPVQAAGAGQQASAPAPAPPDPFQEEAKQFRYVGFLRSGSSDTAFIVRGQEVHTVPVGAMLGERYRVMQVEDDGVVLASPTGDKQVRLSLAADSTLAPRPPGALPPSAPPRGAAR